MEDRLYKVSQLAKLAKTGESTIYKRIEAEGDNITPVYIKGVLHFDKKDSLRLITYRKRGRVGKSK